MDHLTVRGTDIPRLGFGTWELTEQTAYNAVRTALDVGYRHIDTAVIYRNEEAVGRALADSAIDRDELFVTTKVPRSVSSTDEIRRQAEGSLERLGLDHVDLLLIHWPTPDLEVEAVVETLDELREEDQTTLIGVSNHSPDQLRRALEVAPVATNQVEYHPLLEQDALLGILREHGLALTAYSPLAKGGVIGNDTLEEIGQNHGKTSAQVAIRWLLQQPGVMTIPRSQDEGHIRDNFDVFDFELSDDEMKRIDDLPKDQRQLDTSWGPWND